MKAPALVLLAVAAVAAGFFAGRWSRSRVLLVEASPQGIIALVREQPCSDGVCQSLWIGQSPESVSRVATLRSTEYCDEITWAPDGMRVGFLVGGYQLRLYDPGSLAPAGQVSLVGQDATPTTRIARGVTFSENGRAVTFDDCPRGHSGCRSGLVGLPVVRGK
ncbi:MAG TPA: hypothetical protein VD833_18280 [Vicinamibacterales bacterium]|nr:hypothetical protein [Vicinamibacterales bacterium]